MKEIDTRFFFGKIIDALSKIKLHKRADFHPNIIRLFGITREGTANSIHRYSLVLEYADGGTLNAYLNEHFNELDWKDKYQLALQLASAVECIHDFDIIHCDLHADNILVHQKILKLANFGLSKKVTEESSHSTIVVGDILPYIDPKCLDNNVGYIFDKKSDVYSVGILMWQISSGYQPFKGVNYNDDFFFHILNGKREKIIDRTPPEYSDLYQECWKYETDERPNMQKVVSTIKTIISLDHGEMDNANIIEEIELLIKSKHSCKSNRLIRFVIKKHNEGITFDQIKQFIIKQKIFQNENFLNWLKNQQSSQYIWFLGLFYYYSIGVDEDSVKAFELFLKVAEENYSISQVYLAKCYYNGYGINCDKKLSFKWYRKSVENGSMLGQFYLGHCHEYGIGTQKNEKKAVYWYIKAASNGNITAKLHLADCLRIGKGVKKDGNKAFKSYKLLAEKEISDAQYQLGNFFFNGIGIEMNKDQAFYWYNKATRNGNAIAKNILKYYYKFDIELYKDKKYRFFRIIYSEGLRKIGEINKNQTATHISIDSNPFNYIQFNEPTVTIRSGNKSRMCYDYIFKETSEFISTKATISPGISSTSYIEIEKLQELLISRKEDIDDLLKSQSVYAIGIDFQNDSIRPCISCWVAKSLDISILECLEAMFNNQFEAIYQISIVDKSEINQSLNETLSDHIAIECSDSNSADFYILNDEVNSTNNISITSDAIVNALDPKYFQKFTIAARLQAKFSPPKLEYEIDVYLCNTGTMLSALLPLFKKRGFGYFLDSVEVCVSPIPCTPNDMNSLFISIDTPYPQQLNRTVEISNGRETNIEGEIGGEFGSIPKISAKGGIKNISNTKFKSDEWEVNYSGCHTTGNSWSHRYSTNNLDKNGIRRTSYVPDRHSAKWLTKKSMNGFRITITQVLRYKIIHFLKFFPQKPELIPCPVIAHSLEITFNNFENFNAKFAKLANSNQGFYYNDDNINIANPHIQDLDGEIKINRSFVPRD
ncbi:14807_t:CDS:2 [Funneliformis geosporum]|nr:14807_t:CDS:2 [Funneliformis geosporum]